MSTNIKVCVRVRPENEKERAAAQNPVVSVVDEALLVFDPVYTANVTYFHGKAVKDPTSRKPRDVKFAFDRVFSPSTTNIEVYEQTTKCVLRSLVDGYNCSGSVCLWGYWSWQNILHAGIAKTPGVIFLSMMDLYNIKESEQDDKHIDIAVSYLEVYNENIKDLLSPSNDNLPIREDGKQGVIIPGLCVKEPDSAEELLQMLEKGNKNRTQHPTDANAESSRSHAVFQVFVRIRNSAAGLSEEVKTSKLSLIDLAGSERATVTKNRGARFREGANINKSLLALGNCINALADTKRKGSKHIPYRNSKLTRILKDSLGDNCKTVMLAAVSPSRQSYEDTFNTLSYANRAKKIKAVLKKNIINVSARVQNYGKIVDDLQGEVKSRGIILTCVSTAASPDYFMFKVARLKAQLELRDIRPQCSFNIDQLQNDISMAYGERRQIRDDIMHIELMVKQTSFATMRREQTLKRLNMVSSDLYTPGEKTVGKIVRAMSSASNKTMKLEKSKQVELERLNENTDRLRTLVNTGKTLENEHAQEILSLQMKAYHFEQESREYQRQSQHYARLLNSMHEEERHNETIVKMFLEYLESSESILRQNGLQTSRIVDMYTNIKACITKEKHVQFDGERDVEEDTEMFKSIISVPVMSANESSLQISGKAVLAYKETSSADKTLTLEDANGTFTIPHIDSPKREASGSSVLGSPPVQTPPTPSSPASTPPLPSPQPAHGCGVVSPQELNPLSPDQPSEVTRSPTPESDTEKSEESKDVEERASLPNVKPINKFTHIKSQTRSFSDQTVFKPLHEVLGLAKGTGCEEIEAAEGTPDRPPAKLRVLEQPSVPTEATTSGSAFSSTSTAFKDAAKKFQEDLLAQKQVNYATQCDGKPLSDRHTTPEPMDVCTVEEDHAKDTTVVLYKHSPGGASLPTSLISMNKYKH
ncbi:KIF18A [Bugula neritina]|uniref:Kinesin-like protein n=1 Tax=Bugula neritina TaxID=10212 RepID=A0A7J7JZC7_BUGNE|nr:KIF18A [Bugula neritina]